MKEDLILASKEIGLSDQQIDDLKRSLDKIQKTKRQSYFLNALLYLGALIVLFPMTWFYTSHLESKSSLYISLSYGILFFLVGTYFWHRKGLKKAGGLLALLSVTMVPLVIHSLQTIFSFQPHFTSFEHKSIYCWLQSNWTQIELITFAVSLCVLYCIRYSLLVALIYLQTCGILLHALFFFTNTEVSFLAQYSLAAVILGSFLNLLGFGLQKHGELDFSFWSYLFGMSLCWSGMSLWDIRTETGYATYFAIHLALLLLSGFFHRRIFLFFGGLGVIYYIGHLAYIYSDSLFFSYGLALIGFVVMGLSSLLLKLQRKNLTIQSE